MTITVLQHDSQIFILCLRNDASLKAKRALELREI